MAKLAVRVLALAIGAAALMAIATVAPAQAEAGQHVHHMHIKKHGWHRTYPYRGAWVGPPARPIAGSYGQSDWVCPGIGRSFDCKIWPPPFEDDPDRKASKH